MEKYKVTFYPDNKTVEVSKDTTILSAAISAGLYIDSACGGDGVCGRCKVIIRKGNVISQPTGMLNEQERASHIHLACLTSVHGDVEVEIPGSSRVELKAASAYSKTEEIQQVKTGLSEGDFKYSPLAVKIYLELDKPSLFDRAGDLERIYRQIRKAQDFPVMQTGIANIRQLGELLRDADWKVTVTLGKRNHTVEIVLLEAGDTSGKNFGFALDIGTTTISGQLVDLNSRRILGTKASYNKQVSFGSDVITRIIYAKEEDGLEKLHEAVIDTVNEIIKELIEEHGVDLNDVTCIACSGNTTMIHLLLSIDPAHIRKDPYVPTANFIPTIRAREAGININPRGLLSCLPGVASYVGGDVTAGILSCGIYKEEGLCLLIDIGTNGEIALGNKDFIVACAASAGPAFEGSGVSCGMRASRGAIQKVKINPKDFSLAYETIGNAPASGICGSGYIDLICELLDAGIIDKGGKIQNDFAGRLRQSDRGKELVIAPDIFISEADIENLKRAKAAVYAASAILTRHMELDFNRIKKIFIAGGFGTSIDIEKAVRIGLFPDVDRSKYLFVGNSSLAGSRLALLSYEAMKVSEDIAGKVTYFELSVDPAYMDEYMAALFFPHTDLNRFPSLHN